jgi:FixJ family two-component response regulator
VPADSNQFDVRLALVLDDEAGVGLALCKMLAGVGIGARAFVSPDAFLRELEKCNPDLLFLDLALGRSDAIDVIRELEDRRFKGRVMLISGRDTGVLLEVERVGQAHGLSMLRSLPKPFRIADIQDRLRPLPPLQPEQLEGVNGANHKPHAAPLRAKA